MTVDEYNEAFDLECMEGMHEAQQSFSREWGDDVKRWKERFTTIFQDRRDCVSAGNAPRPIAEYDSDELARFLAMPLNYEIFVHVPVEELDEAAIAKITDPFENTSEIPMTMFAQERVDWLATVSVISDYLLAAACLADRLGAARTVRLFLGAMRILDAAMLDESNLAKGGRLRRTLANTYFSHEISASDALRFIKLERIAAEQLWIDICAAEIAKYRPASAGKAIKRPQKHPKRIKTQPSPLNDDAAASGPQPSAGANGSS